MSLNDLLPPNILYLFEGENNEIALNSIILKF